MQISKSTRFILSILSGLLLMLSFPNAGSLAPLALVALAPLFIVEHYIYTKQYRARKVFTHAFITFVIYNFGTCWWIMNADVLGTIVGLIINALIMATFFQFFVWTKRFVGQKEGYIGLLFYWIGLEYFHLNWQFSFPWLNLGNVFATTPSLVQWYSYSGVLGGTLWILLSNLLVFKITYNLWVKKEKFKIQTPFVWMYGILIFIPIGYSLITYYSSSSSEANLRSEIIVTQPNVDPYSEKWRIPVDIQLNNFLNLADSLITPETDFVLAPETAIPYGFEEENFINSSVYEILNKRVESWGNTSLLTGASTYKFFDEKNSFASEFIAERKQFVEHYNTSLLMDKNPPQFVHKSKLVMGVEMIPFSEQLPFLEDLAISNGGTTGNLGTEPVPAIMQSKGIRFAPVVCYESVYGDFIAQQCRKGAMAIFIITNDGWWDDSPGYKQHLNLARLRAIETGRWVARSANTGSSAFINPKGDIVQKTAYNTKTALRQEIELVGKATFYVTYGDVMGRSFGFGFFLMLLFTGVRYMRKLKGF
ncbi:apolipoprotein N-acyltransferase [Lishizhenia sp.]|uniref:apolipoprotein N-acyltransferase n=1 Tax=Lishizhenia sp. TaxID=2497594 RepID=UPI00299F35FA|nr:apolipoprotein N-acyltransferase [Lishizhenia sp.]MDX1445920.1 apolipoprotein N-acyltransferase [Lishizhenia sp.]